MAILVSEIFKFIAENLTLNLPGISESYSNGIAISTGRKWPNCNAGPRKLTAV